MATKQSPELALAVAVTEVGNWRTEEKMAADGIALSRASAVYALKSAVRAGVSQADLAEACGWSRQRVHQLLND